MKPLNKVSSNKGYESGITLAEELRGLSGKLKIPFISAIQSNRNENANTSKVDVSNVSESYGIVSTCDYLGALYQSDEDRMDGRIYFKTLKNRNGNAQTLLYSVNYENLKIEELSK
jgi:replicative DNA helicase